MMQPPDCFDRPEDYIEGIQCRRCGEDGLYWVLVPQFDGKSERPVLFDEATKKRHVCSGGTSSTFAKVPG